MSDSYLLPVLFESLIQAFTRLSVRGDSFQFKVRSKGGTFSFQFYVIGLIATLRFKKKNQRKKRRNKLNIKAPGKKQMDEIPLPRID